MKFFVRQKILTLLTSKYEIMDESGNLVFFVKSNIFFPYKLTFFNENGEAVLQIKKRYFRILSRYDIKIQDQLVAILKRKYSIFQKKFKIKSDLEQLNNIQMQGDIFSYSFQMVKDNKAIASISKKFLSIGDKYTVDIKDIDNRDVYLAVAVAIDDILHKKRKI